MAAFYRRLWVFLAGTGVALFVAYCAVRTCLIVFVVPIFICIALAIPFVFLDRKETEQWNAPR